MHRQHFKLKFTFEVEENDTISLLILNLQRKIIFFLLQYISRLNLVIALLILKVFLPCRIGLTYCKGYYLELLNYAQDLNFFIKKQLN